MLVERFARPQRAFRHHLPFVRSIHQSRPVRATHSPHQPLPPTSSVPRGGPSRLVIVKGESARLWKHVIKLWTNKRLEEALELCKPRLADPFAHVPHPSVATSHELRAMGDYLYADLLTSLHIHDNAPYPDPSKNVEILQTLRRAKFAWSSHFPDELDMRIVVGQELVDALERSHLRKEAAEEGLELLQLSKARLDLLRKDPDTTSEKLRGTLADLLLLYVKCAAVIASSSWNSAALSIVSDARDLIQDYKRQYPVKDWIHILDITLLSMYSILMAEAGKVHDSLPFAYEAVKKVQHLSRDVEAKFPDDGSPEVQALRGIHAPALGMLADIMKSAKIKRYQDVDLAPFCMDCIHISRLVTRLPPTRGDGIPLDFEASCAGCYSTALICLSSITDSPTEQVVLLERSLELLLMSKTPDLSPFRAYAGVISTLANEYYITHLNWEFLSFSDMAQAANILEKVTSIRIQELAARLCTPDGTSQEITIGDTRRLILGEIDRLSQLAAHMETKVVAEVEERESQLIRAIALINRGLYEALDSPKEAAATWKEAITILQKSTSCSNERDLVEQQRLELLEKIHEHLSSPRV